MALENKIQYLKRESRQEFLERVEDTKWYHSLGRKPFDFTDDMVNTVYEITKSYDIGDRRKAVLIFWDLHERIKQELTKAQCKNRDFIWNESGNRTKSASETFEARKGMCDDVSFLYTTMAKIAGFNSGVAFVTYGSYEDHMCSWIRDNDGLVLVDVAQRTYNAKHSRYLLLDDDETITFFNTHCMNYNNRDREAFEESSEYYSRMASGANVDLGGLSRSAIERHNAGNGNNRGTVNIGPPLVFGMTLLAGTLALAANFDKIKNYYANLRPYNFTIEDVQRLLPNFK